jgi:uncharacterized membrane protein HdeD (DUF308 family)
MKQLGQRSSTSLFVFGALAVVFGVIAAIFPVATALTLVVLWGCYALIDGIVAGVMAFRPAEGSSRGLLILTAIVGILAGLFAIFHPISSGVALAWVLGIWLLVRGVMEIISAFSGQRETSRWLLVLGGLLWLAAGVLMVSFPGVAALSISLWIGVLAIIWGIVLVVVGFRVRKASKQQADAAGVRA